MHPDFNPWLNGWGFFVCGDGLELRVSATLNSPQLGGLSVVEVHLIFRLTIAAESGQF